MDLSFSQDRVEAEFVLAGLRRLRAQTNSKAKTEAVHKPIHPQWYRTSSLFVIKTSVLVRISWRDCQVARQRCIDAFVGLEQKDGQGQQQALKRLVCMLFYTIAPPARFCLPILTDGLIDPSN